MPCLKIAHRGWHRDHVENTLPAFRAAYEAGCDMVEFDVQMTRDGVPVIFHDDDGLRLAGIREPIYALDWNDLKRLNLHASRKGAGSPYHIPSLEEFLTEWGSKPFYLELKVPAVKALDNNYLTALGEKVARMLHRAGPHSETFIASFHSGLIRFLARENLFPSLAGIFDNPEYFRVAYAGDAKSSLSGLNPVPSLRYYSLSWKLFRHFFEVESLAMEMDAGRFLAWDIGGEADLLAAVRLDLRGLVSDDVEAMLRV